MAAASCSGASSNELGPQILLRKELDTLLAEASACTDSLQQEALLEQVRPHALP